MHIQNDTNYILNDQIDIDDDDDIDDDVDDDKGVVDEECNAL